MYFPGHLVLKLEEANCLLCFAIKDIRSSIINNVLNRLKKVFGGAEAIKWQEN